MADKQTELVKAIVRNTAQALAPTRLTGSQVAEVIKNQVKLVKPAE